MDRSSIALISATSIEPVKSAIDFPSFLASCSTVDAEAAKALKEIPCSSVHEKRMRKYANITEYL